jgi:hypothetical protein
MSATPQGSRIRCRQQIGLIILVILGWDIADMTSDAAASQGPLAGLKLLVVDDQFLVASLAEDIVLEAGAREAVIATSESEARTALERPDRFDGAVIDVNLGDRPGFELARAL